MQRAAIGSGSCGVYVGRFFKILARGAKTAPLFLNFE